MQPRDGFAMLAHYKQMDLWSVFHFFWGGASVTKEEILNIQTPPRQMGERMESSGEKKICRNKSGGNPIAEWWEENEKPGEGSLMIYKNLHSMLHETPEAQVTK